jgi:hypothetical protein
MKLASASALRRSHVEFWSITYIYIYVLHLSLVSSTLIGHSAAWHDTYIHIITIFHTLNLIQ